MKRDTPKSNRGFPITLKAVLNYLRVQLWQVARDRRAQNRLQFGGALGISIGLVLSISLYTGALGRTTSRLSDLLYQQYAPSNQVVLIAIDHQSIQDFGALPWQRTVLAQLVTTIAQAQPRVMGLNLLLTDATKDDAGLAQAFAQSPRLVQPVIGVEATRLSTPVTAVPNFGVVLKPTSALITPNTLLAQAMLMPDADSILRRVPLTIQENGKDYPALGIAALELAQGITLGPRAQNQVPFGNARLPIDETGRMLINYFDLHSVRLSAGDVLRGTADLAQLRNKIVLIGPSGTVAAQSYQTPVSSQPFSSTEIEALLIETLLNHRLLVEQDGLTQAVMIFLLALLAGATIPHFRILSQAGLVIIYFLLYLGYAFAEFDSGILVQPVYPVLALVLTLVGSAVFRYFSEERHRDFIATLLRRYVAPEDVAKLTTTLDNNNAIPLGGMRRQVSVLALDLTDLEELVDSLTPQALITLLDHYISLAVDVIFQHDGSIIKHTGSAFLAAWNLWTDQPDHALVAVRTAIEIKRALAEFNRKQPKELTIHSGIGIATGAIVAGRIGARPRAEYAIIGQVVGMAERIAVKPERGVFIDVTTRERIGDEFDLIEVRPVQLRHKTDPSNVWQLVETNEPEEAIVNAPDSEPAIEEPNPP